MRYLIFALLLVPGVASAQNWSKASDGTGGRPTFVSPQEGHEVAFYVIPASSTTDSVPIKTSACSSITVEMVDVLGTAANEAELYIRTTNTPSDTCENGRKILADIDGGGLDDVTLNGDHGADEDVDLTAEGRAFLWGFGPVPFLCVDVTVAPGSSDSAYVVLTCSGE